MKYDLGNGLSIPQNTVKVSVLNGGRILAKAIGNGRFQGVIGNQKETLELAQTLVSSQLNGALETVEGDLTGKEETLYRLKLYLINKMLDQAI